MLDCSKIEAAIERFLAGSDYALETIEIGRDNDILVEVDRVAGVDMDFCAGLNRYLVGELDRLFPDENYSLEVGSVSLSSPFKSLVQYQKHLGENVKVTDGEGKCYTGRLLRVEEDKFAIDAGEEVVFSYADIRKTEYQF